jgi:hypothetical protein
MVKSKTGFYRYMGAVQMPVGTDDRQKKLDAIMDTFADDCTVYTSDGLVLRGKTAVFPFNPFSLSIEFLSLLSM